MKLTKRRKYINIRIKNKKYNSLRLIMNHKNPSDLLVLFAVKLITNVSIVKLYTSDYKTRFSWSIMRK